MLSVKTLKRYTSIAGGAQYKSTKGLCKQIEETSMECGRMCT